MLFMDCIGKNDVWNLGYGRNLNIFWSGGQVIQIGKRFATGRLKSWSLNMTFTCFAQISTWLLSGFLKLIDYLENLCLHHQSFLELIGYVATHVYITRFFESNRTPWNLCLYHQDFLNYLVNLKLFPLLPSFF